MLSQKVRCPFYGSVVFRCVNVLWLCSKLSEMAEFTENHILKCVRLDFNWLLLADPVSQEKKRSMIVILNFVN